MSHRHLKLAQHRYRHKEHDEIEDDIEDRVGEVQFRDIEARAFEERVPELWHGVACEEDGEGEGDDVRGGEGEGDVDYGAEAAFGVEAKVEEQDGDFCEADGRDVDDDGGGAPLLAYEYRDVNEFGR